MAVIRKYVCDLCGQENTPDAIRRLGVRLVPADRPEDADNVDVGACCYNRPITDALKLAAMTREGVLNG